MRSRLLLALFLLLSACAPRLAPMGPVTQAPALLADRIVMADGANLPLKAWLPDEAPRAVVVALHGFNDYSNAFAIPARAWVKDGIATYAYDQRGFGKAPDRGMWPGTETLVADVGTATKLIAQRHPGTPLFVVGESMGGAVIMVAVAEGKLKEAQGLILSAPAVRGRETINVFGRIGLWLSAHTVPWLAGRPPPNLGFTPSDNIEMLIALGRDPLVIKETRIDAFYGLIGLMDDALEAAAKFDRDALILLGKHDNLIPSGPTGLMLTRMPPKGEADRRVALYRDGYHMLFRDLQAPVVHRDVAFWMLARNGDRMAGLPSGADKHDSTAIADVPRPDGGTGTPTN
ncbi:MAG TPA: alpha/beta hydrolase [Alphaproteobacteria bacterium]|nr:alpha/beta hydrolase [Alphaproteobacteria bacterium]